MSSSSTVTEKRTVISSSSGGSAGYESLDDIPYKANIGSRTSNILSRSTLPLRHSTGGSGGTSIVRTVEYGYGSNMGGGMGPGGYSNVSSTGVSSVKTSREHEKKELQNLNERFANYIEKVRFLEAQNRKLGSELDELRSKWGKETTHVKQMYEAEMSEARRLIDDLSKDKAALEIKMSSVQEQNADVNRQLDEAKKYRQVDRETINKLNQQIADLESEINMLRRSMESLETERSRDKSTINRLQQEVDKHRIDLNNETLAHLDAENRRQTLEEEMEFMKKVHEQELKELAALAYRDTTAENREFWKNELGQAIRDIQQEYDAKVDQLRGDMEGFYNLKIQEFRTGATKQNMEVTHIREENKKISKQMSDLRGKLADMEARNAQLEKQYHDVLRELETKETDHMMECTQFREEISKLRTEMEGILQELQTLMDAKLSLELEICAYRKLLEGEENRVDWRSRASLIMNRDAFRPSIPAYERSEPEKEKEPVVKEPEPIFEKIEKKAEATVSCIPEPLDASPDTDAASSITMSDRDLTSPKGELAPSDELASETGNTVVEDDGKVDEVENLDNGERVSSHIDDEPSSPANNTIIVKQEIEKIESRVKDTTDGQTTPEIVSPKNESTLDKDTVDVPEQTGAQKREPNDTTDSGDKIEINNTGKQGDAKIESPVDDSKPETHMKDMDDNYKSGDDKDKIIIENEVKAGSPVVSQAVSSSDDDIRKEPKLEGTNETVEEEATLKHEELETPSVEQDIDQQHGNGDTSTEEVIKAESPVKPELVSLSEYMQQEVKQGGSKDDEQSSKDKSPEQSEPQGNKLSPEKSPLVESSSSVKHQEDVIPAESPVKPQIVSLSESMQKEVPVDTNLDSTEDRKDEIASEEASESKAVMSDSATLEVVENESAKTSPLTSPVEKEVKVEAGHVDENKDNMKESEIGHDKSEITESEGKSSVQEDVVDVSEIVEKTEDKVLETVVTSEVIEQETKSDSAIVEKSPTRELPERPIGEQEPVIETPQNESKPASDALADKEVHKDDQADTVSDDKVNTESAGNQIDEKQTGELIGSTEKAVSETVGEEVQVSVKTDPDAEEVKRVTFPLETATPPPTPETSRLSPEFEKQSTVMSSEQEIGNEDIKSKTEEEIIETPKQERLDENTESKDKPIAEVMPVIESKSEPDNQKTENTATDTENTSEKTINITTNEDKPETHIANETIKQTDELEKKTDIQCQSTSDIQSDQTDSNDINKTETHVLEATESTEITKLDNTEAQITDQPESSKIMEHIEADNKESETAGQAEPNEVTKSDSNAPLEKERSDSNQISESDTEIKTQANSENDDKPLIDNTNNTNVASEHQQPGNTPALDTTDSINVTNTEQEEPDSVHNEKSTSPSAQPETVVLDESSKEPKINGVSEDVPATDETKTKQTDIQKIEKLLINGDDSQVSMKMMRGEVSAKTTYQRTSTGPIAISEVSPEGKFIMLENTSSGPNRRDVNLDGWKLRRMVDGKRDYSYNFRNFTLKSGKKVKILARGAASDAGLNDLVFREEDNWGVGSQVNTALCNDKEEEKASHIQKTLYN